MKKQIAALIFGFLLIALMPGCTCNQEQQDDGGGVSTGFTNPEDLARVYLKTIEDKNVEGLKNLFLTENELKMLNIKRAKKQQLMGYFTHNKRLFLNKNKDLLGRKLTFLSFRPGSEIKVNPDVSVFRGAQILAEQDDGKRVSIEVNFMIRVKGFWKVLFLRYLHPKANVGQGPKLPEAGKEPAMKVPGEKPKLEISVKKVEKDKAEEPQPPAQDDSKESLEELKKLFDQ